MANAPKRTEEITMATFEKKGTNAGKAL